MRQKVVHARGVDVIEDCYNANPDSMKAALAMFREYPCKRRFALLGDMLELGELSREAHEELGRLAAEGTVQILGGCCGTTPAHIAALRAELDSLPVVEKTAPAEEFSTVKKQTVENEDAFLRKLNAGEKVIAIELDSPRNADLTGYLEGAKKLQAAGADLLTIADCPIAQARMDSSLVACRVHRELGLCTLSLIHISEPTRPY